MAKASDEPRFTALMARVDRALRRHQGLHLDSRETGLLQELLQAQLLTQASPDSARPDLTSPNLTFKVYQPVQAARQQAELRKLEAALPRSNHA